MQEHLAVREEWSKKGRWTQPEKLAAILRPDQSTWAFESAASDCSVSNGLEPPWIELHAVSFLVQASKVAYRNKITVVAFPRSRIPAALIADDRGEHLIAYLDHWHRTLDSNSESSRTALARNTSPHVQIRKFTRTQLAPLLQELLDRDLVRSDLRAVAEDLVRLAE